MGVGVAMVAPDGSRQTLSQSAHGSGCNNEAELRAVMLALEQLKACGATRIRIHSDNSIVVAQLRSSADQVAEPIVRLAAKFDAARALAAGFKSVEIVWIPRSRNAEADVLARAALGVGPKQRKAKHARR